MLQVLLGDVGAGKSSLVLRFVKGQFVEFQVSTEGLLRAITLAVEIVMFAFGASALFFCHCRNQP